MRKWIIVMGLLVSIAAAALAGSCSFKPKLIEPELGVAFDLPIGRDAEVLNEGLRLTFEEVVSDSRCPLAVECVTIGEAVYTISFKKDDVKETITLTEEGLGGEGTATFQGYTITALLQPYPNQPDDIEPEDYSLWMTISK